uniref:Ovule protein n=1 Tax=Parascaris univalens TaxID=6257 RepID=A0A915B183_PARUN
MKSRELVSAKLLRFKSSVARITPILSFYCVFTNCWRDKWIGKGILFRTSSPRSIRSLLDWSEKGKWTKSVAYRCE